MTLTHDKSFPGPEADAPWLAGIQEEQGRTWAPSPYLHLGPDAIHNPHTGLELRSGDAGFAYLRRWMQDGSLPVAEPTDAMSGYVQDRWLVPSDHRLDYEYHLKYVQLEAHTVCNQSCYFCPVSIAPREAHSMEMDFYRDIARQVAELDQPIEAVFMIAYNEPTADPRFVEQVQVLREAGLPPATLTNGSGLTPKRVDQLIELGGLRFLSINLSTLDRERYAEDRGKDQLPLVLRNLDYAQNRPVADQMDIVVLGTGDEVHQRDFEEIQERFEGTRFTAKHFVVNDRAGYLEVGMIGDGVDRRLGGCDYMGSRPIQHIHINPYGQLLLCCQDYDEKEVLGDLREQSLAEILVSEPFARARRMVYGLEEAPASYICRNCKYSLTR